MHRTRSISNAQSTGKTKRIISELEDHVNALSTAIDNSDENAMIKALSELQDKAKESKNRCKALARANVIPYLISVVNASNVSASVCDKVLTIISYMTRFNDEKSAINLDNIKAYGIAGAPEILYNILKRNAGSIHHVVLVCSCIRNLCAFEANKNLLGNAGLCEIMTRALLKYNLDATVCSWACRAIGHLAYNHDENRFRLTQAGACEHIVGVLQNHSSSESAAGEACWAIRNLAKNVKDLGSSSDTIEGMEGMTSESLVRLAATTAAESLVAVMKLHFASETFMLEAMKASSALIANEHDLDMISRLYSSGTLTIALKCAKKLPDSDGIAKWTLFILYMLTCDDVIRSKLSGLDTLDALTVMVQTHANTEGVSEYGCRAMYNLTLVGGGVSSRMRTAGLLETVVGAIQRQAMSSAVAEYGSLALGALAADEENLYRLIGSGAGAAVVASLRQHKKSPYVVSRASFAVHHLANGINNISWLGACGTCEAILTALSLHVESNAVVAHMGVRAIGSLAYHEEGNISKLKGAGVTEIVLKAFKTHLNNADVAENCSRAIYNLCLNSALVSEFGSLSACEDAVIASMTHKGNESVVTQSLLAISSLAVRRKNEKVHQSNIRKLVNAGAIESVVDLMTRYQTKAGVLRSAGLAVASLARQDTYSVKLGSLGATKLVLKCLQMHKDDKDAVTSLFAAVNSLSAEDQLNREFFAQNGIISIVFAAMFTHEKGEMLIAESFRILVTIAVDEARRKEMVTDNQLKLVTRVIKIHEKHEFAAKWGCTFISTIAENDSVRASFGKVRACEVVIGVLSKHNGDKDDEHHEAFKIGASVIELANKAVVALALEEENRSRFNNADSCEAVVKSMKVHMSDAGAVEWACAAMVSLSSNSSCINLLGSADATSVITTAIKEHTGSEIIVRLVCELVAILSKDDHNKSKFGTCGMCDALPDVLSFHLQSAPVCLQVCRAICALVKDNDYNFDKISSTSICELISKALMTHSYNAVTCRWACTAISHMCYGSHANQNIFEANSSAENLVSTLIKQKGQQSTVEEALKAIRRMATENIRVATKFSSSGVISAVFDVISRHFSDSGIVEQSGWIIGACCTIIDSEFYSSPVYWEKLESCIKTHAAKESTVRWICDAIGKFASLADISRSSACDLVMNMLARHSSSPYLISKAAQAIAHLASNPVNRQHLATIGATESIGAYIITYVDKSIPKVGLFHAISNLIQTPDSQKKFGDIPKACAMLVKALYEDIEYDDIALWGCRAISAVARNNKVNVHLLGSTANFTEEILKEHKNNLEIVKAAFETISVLCRNNTANRSLFGVSGTCDEVGEALPLLSYEDESIARLACSVIAGLAANHPNNQHKLGMNGACDYLVGVLKDHCLDEAMELRDAILTTRVACWAVANVVQLGKGRNNAVEEEGVRRIPSLKGMSITSGLKLSESKLTKNSHKFDELGIVPISIALLNKFRSHVSKDPETVMWIIRMINNLVKGKTLRGKFNDAGVEALLAEIDSPLIKAVHEWVGITKETLREDSRSDSARSK